MTRSPLSPKNFAALALAIAFCVFAPGSAFAQHAGHSGGGGGHMGGGGGFGGGHTGGGFGGGHSGGGSRPSGGSAPSHSAPPARSAPVTNPRPPVAASSSTPAPTSGHPASTTTSANGNAVVRTPNFGAPASTNSSASPTFALRGRPAPPRTSVIGFPPSESHVASVDPGLRSSSGALSFSGQGRDIWQNSPSSSHSVNAAPASTAERGIFSRSPSLTARPVPPHRVYLPTFGSQVFFVPVYYSPLGYYGNGFCDPFWGFDPAFGCGGFGYGGGFGFGFGYGYGYGGYFGSTYGGSYSVGSTTGPMDYENDTPSNDFGTYAVPAPAPEQGSDQSSQPAAPAPSLTVIYLKDGTNFDVMSYWLDAGKLHYITNYGGESTIDMGQLDLQRTVDENARLGVAFTLRPVPPAAQAPQP